MLQRKKGDRIKIETTNCQFDDSWLCNIMILKSIQPIPLHSEKSVIPRKELL